MIDCKILKASVSDAGIILSTLELSLPKFLLAQLNTHRVFSRNAASSRAMNSGKLLNAEPFIPKAFPKECPGMAGKEDLGQGPKELHLEAFEQAKGVVRKMIAAGVHKEYTNRYLEPFMMVRVIVSSTDWNNFLALRDSPHAQPEMQELAQAMRRKLEVIYDRSCGVTQVVLRNDWHLPLTEDIVELRKVYTEVEIRMISAGRCARVSYLNHGARLPQQDLALAERLLGDGHLSPFEHQATPLKGRHANFRGWKQQRLTIANESNFMGGGFADW